MSTLNPEIIQLAVSTEMKRQFEEGAQRLNLRPEAYFAYLIMRMQPGVDAVRLDRHAREVFGKHGELMRRLAK